jgi:glutamate synthase domain-containing protein 3
MTEATAQTAATAAVQPQQPSQPSQPSTPISGYRHQAPTVTREDSRAIIDANQIYYRELNETIAALVEEGVHDLLLQNVNGQRYIANGLTAPDLRLRIEGVPGQDLGMFFGGGRIEVCANAQDGVGNTMEDGEIIIRGSAGDVVGYGMRGGLILIAQDAGYRVGIHMKEYKQRIPTIVVGGKARDFFGEYMAGGRMVLLNVSSQLAGAPLGNFTGTGMHGGELFIRGRIGSDLSPENCGREVGLFEATDADKDRIRPAVTRFCEEFNHDAAALLAEPFIRVAPSSSRPYGNLYAPL